MQSRNLALAVASSLALLLAAQSLAADQPIKTKPNIKNDIIVSSCTENCEAAGYAWAKANGATDAEDCDAANEEAAAGCRNFVLEGMPATPAEGTASVPPLEADAADAARAAADAAADETDSSGEADTAEEAAAREASDAAGEATDSAGDASDAAGDATDAPRDSTDAPGDATDAPVEDMADMAGQKG